MKHASLVVSLALLGTAISALYLLSRTGGSGAIEKGAAAQADRGEPSRSAAVVQPAEQAPSAGRAPAVEEALRIPNADVTPTAAITPQPPAAIEGLVVDAVGEPAMAQVEFDSARVGEHATSTDAAGRFRFEELSPGSYSIRAWTEDGTAEASVAVCGGERVRNLVLVLGAAGNVEGLVLGAEDEPLAGFTVHLMLGMHELQDRISAADGSFRFDSISVGEYVVVTSSDPSTSEEAAVLASMWSAVVRVEAGRTARVVLRSPERAEVHVHGLVTRAGAPVIQAQLLFLREGAAVVGTARVATTNERGEYAAKLDGPGRFVLCVGAQGMQRAPQHTALVEVPAQRELTLDVPLPGGAIEGRVLGPTGEPVLARLHVAREDRLLELEIFEQQPDTETDEKGHYAVLDLAPGVYILRVEPRGTELAAGVEDRVHVDTGATHVDVALKRAGRVCGRVIDDEGRPVQGAAVHVRDARGRVLCPRGTAFSDANGRFLCEGLPLGAVALSARTRAMLSAESTAVATDSGDAPAVELSLAPGTLVRVALIDRDGRSTVAGIHVVDEHERDLSPLLPPYDVALAMAQGFSTGATLVGPLAPGVYRVIATAEDGRRVEREVALHGAPEARIELRLE